MLVHTLTQRMLQACDMGSTLSNPLHTLLRDWPPAHRALVA